MEIGVTFPQPEIGENPRTIGQFATRIENAGYQHLLAYDHVLGVNGDREDFDGPYNHRDQFHEPLTTFAYLAAHTTDLEYVTGILILPQRQTALVAKQAAQVDHFTDGRFRLGVGLGWNDREYVALNEDFSTRGRRVEAQVEVLRTLWTNDLVEYDGPFHHLPDVGINPLPIQQPIPIWMGGSADPVKRRIARLADGWLPQFQPGDDAEEHVSDLERYAEEAGRSIDEIGIHGRVSIAPNEEDEWIERVQAWRDFGAEYLSLTTMYHGLRGAEHTDHLERVATVLADVDLQ